MPNFALQTKIYLQVDRHFENDDVIVENSWHHRNAYVYTSFESSHLGELESVFYVEMKRMLEELGWFLILET